MTRAERLLDLCLAATAACFAHAAWRAAGTDGAAVVWVAVLLNVLVALLFLRRSRVRVHPTLRGVMACAPALLIGGVALKLAPEAAEWPLAANVLFVVGALFAATSLASLGRSFGILPTVREVVSRGPYRLVRHPAYAGELIMVLACAVALSTWWAPLLVLVTCACVVLRIRAEETLLVREPAYAAYTTTVRHRLVPYVW